MKINAIYLIVNLYLLDLRFGLGGFVVSQNKDVNVVTSAGFNGSPVVRD